MAWSTGVWEDWGSFLFSRCYHMDPCTISARSCCDQFCDYGERGLLLSYAMLRYDLCDKVKKA